MLQPGRDSARICSNAPRMRAAAILGLGTAAADLQPFRAGSTTAWAEGLPAAPSEADAIVIFGGDGTIHRHLPALVHLRLPVLVVPAGSGNDFARALHLCSSGDSLKAWRNFESGNAQPRTIDLGIIRSAASPEIERYFCCVAGCGLDSIAARRANQMPRWLRGHGGYALALLPALFNLPAYSMRLTRWNGGEENRDEIRRPTLLAAFANTQFYGDGMRIAPQADPDGRQTRHLPHFEDESFPTVLYVPYRVFRTTSLSPKVEYSKAERVRVEAETPLGDLCRWRVCLRDARRDFISPGRASRDWSSALELKWRVRRRPERHLVQRMMRPRKLALSACPRSGHQAQGSAREHSRAARQEIPIVGSRCAP